MSVVHRTCSERAGRALRQSGRVLRARSPRSSRSSCCCFALPPAKPGCGVLFLDGFRFLDNVRRRRRSDHRPPLLAVLPGHGDHAGHVEHGHGLLHHLPLRRDSVPAGAAAARVADRDLQVPGVRRAVARGRSSSSSCRSSGPTPGTSRWPSLFAVWTFLFSVPFLVLCSGAGHAGRLVLVRWFPRGAVGRVAAGARRWRGAGVGWCWLPRGWTTRPDAPTFNARRGWSRACARLQPLLPSWWVAEGIMSLSRGQCGAGVMLLASAARRPCVAVRGRGVGRVRDCSTNAGSASCGGRTPRAGGRGAVAALGAGARRAAGRRARHGAEGRADVPARPDAVVAGADLLRPAGALLRQPALVPTTTTLARSGATLIAFLNVFSVSAVMCSLGSRFVYPQLSLEGHGVLDPGPLADHHAAHPADQVRDGRPRGCCGAASALMLLSSSMLRRGSWRLAVVLGLVAPSRSRCAGCRRGWAPSSST